MFLPDKLSTKKIRWKQDLNLRGETPSDDTQFKSLALTTRPYQLDHRLPRFHPTIQNPPGKYRPEPGISSDEHCTANSTILDSQLLRHTPTHLFVPFERLYHGLLDSIHNIGISRGLC